MMIACMLSKVTACSQCSQAIRFYLIKLFKWELVEIQPQKIKSDNANLLQSYLHEEGPEKSFKYK